MWSATGYRNKLLKLHMFQLSSFLTNYRKRNAPIYPPSRKVICTSNFCHPSSASTLSRNKDLSVESTVDISYLQQSVSPIRKPSFKREGRGRTLLHPKIMQGNLWFWQNFWMSYSFDNVMVHPDYLLSFKPPL